MRGLEFSILLRELEPECNGFQFILIREADGNSSRRMPTDWRSAALSLQSHLAVGNRFKRRLKPQIQRSTPALDGHSGGTPSGTMPTDHLLDRTRPVGGGIVPQNPDGPRPSWNAHLGTVEKFLTLETFSCICVPGEAGGAISKNSGLDFDRSDDECFLAPDRTCTTLDER